MTNDELKDKQAETLKGLKKHNTERKTEIVNDTDGKPTTVTQYKDEDSQQNDTPDMEMVEPEEKLIMSHVCPYCGTMAYIGQIHGLGYCKEKPQYEQ